MAEIADEITIGVITLRPDEPYCYTAWGFHYRFKGGEWRVVGMAFRKKSDAEDWMKERYLKYKGMEGEVIPVKQCLLLDEKGHTKTWTEELG